MSHSLFYIKRVNVTEVFTHRMVNQNILIKSASLAITLAGGLFLAISPVSAEMETTGGDFGASEPDGVSVENYGDNTGEISLPEENVTPAFDSEGGDFGASEPDGLSIEAYGDNTGEVNIPNREGTRDPEETDNEATRSPDFGASEPNGVDIDNYGENETVY